MTNELPEVLFKDDYVLAMNKPSGMLVHRGWGRDRVVLVDIVKEILGKETVHPIHRIDRGTSGIVLFGLAPEIASTLQSGFQDGGVVKRYLALVRGEAPDFGEIDHPIPRKENGPRVPAQTSFKRLATAQTKPRHVSLVEAFPKTGRLHQVRRHLKHINHPVIGDANYGKGQINREMASRYGLTRLALHAQSLQFIHPVTEQKMDIHAQLPTDLKESFGLMGLFNNNAGNLE